VSIDTYRGGNGIANYQPRNQPAVRPRTVQRLTEWAESAMAAHQVAESLVCTSFVPEAFRNKPHEATAAILAGDEVGLSPMASLRAFDIINGTAAPRAITQRAIVQSKGHDIWLVESTDTRAVFRGQRIGSSKVQESVWTIDRARKLKLTNKPNWQNQATAMLIARATSECCRLVASDALMGIPYSAEELWDGVDAGDLPVSAPATQDQPGAESAPTTRRTAQRRTQPRSAPAEPQTVPPEEPTAAEPTGPALPGEDGYDEPAQEAPSEPSITKDQLTKLHTVFSTGGVNNRDTRLQACCLIIGREIESSKDLTKVEAIKLIDQLEQFAEGGELAFVITELIGEPEAGDPS
jgi:hypothetical protein